MTAADQAFSPIGEKGADEIAPPGWGPSAAVIQAERAVVGAAIESRHGAELAADLVCPADFHVPAHQLVAEAVAALVESDGPVDPTAVLGELQRRGTLPRVGGAAAVFGLLEYAGMSPTLEYHARVVAADAARRRVFEAARRVQQFAARAAGWDPDADPDTARQWLEDALAAGEGASPARSPAELLPAVLDDLESPQADDGGVPTGYTDLDRMIPGLRPGQLIVIGARPAAGKSTVGLDLARHAGVRLRLPTLLVSLEMSSTEVMHRLISAESRVELSRLQARQLVDDDWRRIAAVHALMNEAALLIDDTPDCRLAHIRARLRGMARTAPARLVVIDYLQLMGTPRAETRERAVASLSRGMKLIAREFCVPVVVLAQLNRGPEMRNDKRPHLSDLRESGAIEQDADVVLLLHREDMYDPESPRQGEIDVIVAKQRQGPTGTIALGWQGYYGRCANLARAS